MAAMQALFAIRRGGVEIGGVLFGSFEGDRLILQAFRLLECEHAAGPSFILSDSDQVRLDELLATVTEDPELVGLVPAGLFRSRTRSEISLSEDDVLIFDKYFPYLRQVVLVLRPEPTGVTRAGFFVREEDGSLRAESSYFEFLVELEGVEPEGGAGVPQESAAESAASPPPPAEIELPPPAPLQADHGSTADSAAPPPLAEVELPSPAPLRADFSPKLDFLTTVSKPRSYAQAAWILVFSVGLTAASLAAREYLTVRPAPPPQMAPAPAHQIQSCETEPGWKSQGPAATAPRSERLIGDGNYLQSMAVDRGMAEVLAEALRRKGFQALVTGGPTEDIFRVLVGPADDDAALARLKANLQAEGFASFVRRYRSE
jgi:hypothetical protein